jgi:hypothetical protein
VASIDGAVDRNQLQFPGNVPAAALERAGLGPYLVVDEHSEALALRSPV